MTGSEALAYFALELARASAALGLPTALQVVPQYADERRSGTSPAVLAYSVPTDAERRVYVMWHFLWGASKRQLRCVARHEAAHVAMGHAGIWEDELEVDAELARRWREPAGCGLRNEEEYR